jgi:hypothetical protein
LRYQDPMRPPVSQEQLNRRKEVRHTVHLIGRLRIGENSFPLEVGDLSVSGALILMKDPPAAGTQAELWIEGYGPIAIQIVHGGAYFCGISFNDPAEHRLKLQHWLGEDRARRQTIAASAA